MMESEPGSTILSPPWMKTCRCHRREAWELWNMSRHRQIWMVAPASRMSPFLPKGGITTSPSIPYVTRGTLSSCPSTLSRASWGLGRKEPQGGKQGQAGRCCWGHVSPTMLRAQQAVEDLLHHDGVELDEFRQGLDHLFLRGKGREGRPDVPLLLRQAAPGPRPVLSSSHAPVPWHWALSPALRAWLSPSLITPFVSLLPWANSLIPPEKEVSLTPLHTNDGSSPKAMGWQGITVILT